MKVTFFEFFSYEIFHMIVKIFFDINSTSKVPNRHWSLIKLYCITENAEVEILKSNQICK